MSSRSIICFDASIRNGKVGIGIFDKTSKKKIYKSFIDNNYTSGDAERIALIATLQYIQEHNINCANIFTDNMGVAREGICKNMLKKYRCKGKFFDLHWIPREMNEEADRLSKKGSEVNKVNISELTNTSEFNLKIAIKEYSIERRIELLKRLAKDQFEMDFVNFIQENNNKMIKLPNKTDNKTFVNFALTIFTSEELHGVKKVKANKGKTKFSSSKIERFIRARNLI